MSTTLKDIAAAAGVSIGTVDRALKNRGRINPQVAEKIKKIAKEMNYQTNKIASGLVNSSRKYKIAIILHIMGNDFFDEILKGIRKAEREIRDYGMSIKIYSCEDFNAEMQLENIELALRENADAIIIVPINSALIRKKIRELSKQKFPVVFLNTYLKRISAFSSIHCDYFRSGRIGAMLTTLISNNNGRVIAFFPSSVMLGNNSRKEGCQNYFDTNTECAVLKDIVELTNNADINYKIVRDTLIKEQDVNCILFCGDSKMGISVLHELKRPIKAVFYDLGKETKQAIKEGKVNVAITQDPVEQGYMSVYVLFQYFSMGKIPPKEILMDCKIVFKESID